MTPKPTKLDRRQLKVMLKLAARGPCPASRGTAGAMVAQDVCLRLLRLGLVRRFGKAASHVYGLTDAGHAALWRQKIAEVESAATSKDTKTDLAKLENPPLHFPPAMGS